ncbi:fungal-specific transcription factor domain-containing protein [Sodiomyces alkalinus F11]|uniref:Fungal-specific transcription factor domain-containing protein n=1 Tax=Sodiomyces alkalinus (strain CBS 110278 / VKM F-3762 / F11) TaxID=1314773 RepID=A0A3N2Q2Z6_SODAK|nr:fungal-specific transcription factor domain-containing protein [Sodiomyces alkalinus F11]ROT41141.1 fungal-specific transcription factor domain-containing protein [Sodiomyces alkalinus F11]
MNAADIYRQAPGFNAYLPPGPPAAHLPPQPFSYAAPRSAPPIAAPLQPRGNQQLDDDDSSSHPARIAHTLTACCRCRQRKTRCDPTLPRCLPCERSGSICEYYDASKGRKIGRNYVVKLQEKVRQLEAELAQYTDEDNDRPRTNEDVVRPGGLVRLPGSDEPPRYLGPSSGIAMTRLVMEQAKAFTDSKRISDLIPEVRARRQTRMQSIVMTNPVKRKKSYPITSAHPAKTLPARHVANKLVDIFCQRSQVFWPTLHEKLFVRDLEAVFSGDSDPHKNFVCRMVFAISLQQLGLHYAGLADSYYLAAMDHLEKVVRPKDVKTLQCLALICQYSLLTPTRVSVYYVIGMATRICQAEGLCDEKTISASYSMGLMDPLTLDMRRRLFYIISSMELGLAYSMGRPNGLAKGDDFMDVKPFAPAGDEHITEEGILPAPPSEKKVIAIHFFRMRVLQSEIKRILYEKKRPEPRNETHPWFAKMEKDIQDWIDGSPQNPAWCKAWFTGHAQQLRIFLHRPSPQVPKPSARGAAICYDAASYIINLSKFQMEKSATDITWIFVSNLFMCLNTLLWAVSYADIRRAHSREEVDELIQVTLDILDQEPCSQRWPGSSAASHLYSIMAKACLQVYDDAKEPPTAPPNAFFDVNMPRDADLSAAPGTPFQGNGNSGAPQFGAVFNATPEAMNAFGYNSNQNHPPHPTFRSNSIFMSPASNESGSGRRCSAYPPESPMDDSTPPAFNPGRLPTSVTPGPNGTVNAMPTPPESLNASIRSVETPGSARSTVSPPSGAHSTPTMAHSTPTMADSSPAIPGPNIVHPTTTNMSPPPPPQPKMPGQTQAPQRGTTFVVPPAPQPSIPQRPLPSDGTIDWFAPPPPFMSPYSFNPMSNNGFFNDVQMNGFGNVQGAGLGLGPFSNIGSFSGQPVGWNPERHGSLTQEQQVELMNALENEGLGEIDAFLSMDTNTTPGIPTSNGWS